MIEEGLLDRYGTPDAAFAIHVSPRDPSGEVFTRPGTLMAGAGVFRIIIKGRAGHPAEPHHALDPIPIASEVVLALQTYVTRRVKVFEPAVVTVTAIQAGSPEVGAIPETAILTGTIRAVSEETLNRLFKAVRRTRSEYRLGTWSRSGSQSRSWLPSCRERPRRCRCGR